MATTLKVTFVPAETVWLCGWVTMAGNGAAEAMNGLTYQALTSVTAARVSILQYAMGVK